MAMNDTDVFVNCPFDEDYKPLFEAILYVVVRSGYRVRCALETDDAGDNRFTKICNIIAECKFGIHDISRTETGGDPPLPRFNMPLELGLFLGAKKFGVRRHKEKISIIFDREKYRFQKFISDIAGQDIRSHEQKSELLIGELSTWLRSQPGGKQVGGGVALAAEYKQFRVDLPKICKVRKLEVVEASFSDLNDIITQYVIAL